MKRDAYGDDGPMHKRQRHADDEVTFLIPSKVAGSIIGKGGSNISKLRNEYKASITVPDCPGPERVLSITASDIDTIMEIVKDILPSLADERPKTDCARRVMTVTSLRRLCDGRDAGYRPY
ncbi:unnamed protein product [Euphydryas editha]|uniref:K Homology domain-containing protein n=1 Tax=Euphydryas editha TaxID=104508 RepID=A0AAU9TP93_EUPED|nr:unnamed protein product [Euphydryas editha]